MSCSRRRRHLSLVAAVACAAASAIAALPAMGAGADAVAGARASTPPGWSARRDGATGRVRYAARMPRSGAPVVGKTLPDAARSVLAEWAPALGLAPDLSDLVVKYERAGIARRVVVFEQRVEGLPVLGAEVGVTFVGEEPVAVASTYAPAGAAARGERPRATLDAALAIERVRAALAAGRGAALRAPAGADGGHAPRATACWFPSPDGALRLAFEVCLPLEEPHGDWRGVVDAGTGEVLLLEDNARYSSEPARAGGGPIGQVFNPNPVVTLQDLSLQDSGDADQAAFNAAYQPVTLDSARFIGGVYRLEGPYVRIADIASPIITPPTSASGDFTTTRADDAFEAVMVFYHIDSAQRLIQSLGFTGPSSVANFQLAADPHGFGDLDNSAYFPSTKDVRFGDGCVDDAEDADVIYHEYGHAIQDNQVPGFGTSVSSRSLGEGFGDYWAASLSARNGGGFDEAQVFDWDRGPAEGCWAGRRVDAFLTMADYITSPDPPARYENGKIWSGALWAIRTAVGADVADQLILESHFGLSPDATFEDNARSYVIADSAIYSGAHVPAIVAEFETRGIFPDLNAPTLTLGVLQNPVLTSYLDVVVVSSEGLDSTSVTGSVNAAAVAFRKQDAGSRLYRGEHRISAPGALTIVVNAADAAGNATSESRGFTAAKTSADVATTVTSPDGRFSARVPAGALASETWILVGAAEDPDASGKGAAGAGGVALASAYVIGPVGARPSVPIEVTLDPPPGGSLDGARLVLLETGEALDTWLDQDTGALVASLPILGTVVARPGGAPAPRLDRAFLALGPAVPNPATGPTRIAFEVRAPQRVSLAVYSVAGERVRALLSGRVPPGSIAAEWDGRDEAGRRVASGVYIFHLEGERGAASRKVTVLR